MTGLYALLLCLPLAIPTVEVEALPFDPAALAKLPQVELRVTEKGTPVVYQGVPLRALLEPKLAGDDEMTTLRSLVDAVILLRAEDGYQVAVSAAEVAMDREGARFLLALRRDGEPLRAGQGPAKLIIPGDPKPVRWIRQVTAVELVRLPKVAPQPPPRR